MIVRVLTRACAGLAVVALMAACDDNPLAENRERGAWFELNPSNVAVNAGGEVVVSAIVRNQFGAATSAAVTGTPCDARISAARDTTRSVWELPERFVVTGNTLGTTCLVVSGGGLTDTITVRVVPASIRAIGADTLEQRVGSGESVQAQVNFFNTAGEPVTGFDLSDITWTSLTTAQATVDSTGVITGVQPGMAQVVARLHSRHGVTRVDTLVFRVQAGAFTGTVEQTTIGPATGQIAALTFTQATPAFDANTTVELRLNGELVRTFTTVSTGTTRQVVLPFGIPAGSVLRYNVLNIGPTEIAHTGTITLPQGTPAADTQEPDHTLATPKAMTPGQTFWGSLSATDTRDIIRLTVTEAGTYTVTAAWNEVSGHATGTPPGTDIDMYVLSSTGQALLELETFSVAQESGNVTLQPGTYFILLDVWAYIGNENLASTTYRVTAVRQ